MWDVSDYSDYSDCMTHYSVFLRSLQNSPAVSASQRSKSVFSFSVFSNVFRSSKI